jgi:hypothetical protein
MPTKRTAGGSSKEEAGIASAKFQKCIDFFSRPSEAEPVEIELAEFESRLANIQRLVGLMSQGQLKEIFSAASEPQFRLGDSDEVYETRMERFLATVIEKVEGWYRAYLYNRLADTLQNISKDAVRDRSLGVVVEEVDGVCQPEVVMHYRALIHWKDKLAELGSVQRGKPALGSWRAKEVVKVLVDMYRRNGFSPVMVPEFDIDKNGLGLLSKLIQIVMSSTCERDKAELKSFLIERLNPVTVKEWGDFGTQMWLSLFDLVAPYPRPEQIGKHMAELKRVLTGRVRQPNQESHEVLAAEVTALSVLAKVNSKSSFGLGFLQLSRGLLDFFVVAKRASAYEVIEVFCGPDNRLEAIIKYLDSYNDRFAYSHQQGILANLFMLARRESGVRPCMAEFAARLITSLSTKKPIELKLGLKRMYTSQAFLLQVKAELDRSLLEERAAAAAAGGGGGVGRVAPLSVLADAVVKPGLGETWVLEAPV